MSAVRLLTFKKKKIVADVTPDPIMLDNMDHRALSKQHQHTHFLQLMIKTNLNELRLQQLIDEMKMKMKIINNKADSK